MLPDRREPRSGSERNHVHLRWWCTSSTKPSAIRCGYGSKIPDSGLGGIRSALSRIADSTSDISIPGRSAFILTSDPVQGVLDRQPPHPATLRPHHKSMEGWLSGRPDPRWRWTIRDTRRSPLLPSREWPAWKSNPPDPTRAPLRQTCPEARADPGGAGPPGPTERQWNDVDRTEPTPTGPGSGNHPPETVDPDPPPRSTHKPPPTQKPKDSETD